MRKGHFPCAGRLSIRAEQKLKWALERSRFSYLNTKKGVPQIMMLKNTGKISALAHFHHSIAFAGKLEIPDTLIL